MPQQLHMQRREGGEIPAGASPSSHASNSGRGQTLARCACPWALRGAGGRALIEARNGFLRLRQSAPHLRFQQGQQS